ncbi:MAG: fibronectin type III domain-containing protein [Thaumarchaeota archaeon]|nr:fibronectin type III domain-containing protein [Nitrososphaerota archaeon]
MVTRKHNIVGKQFLTLSFAVLMMFSFVMLSHTVYASTTYSITKTKSGLVASDPLDNQTETKQQVLSDTRYWNYYGTAVSEKNTTYDIYKDSQGLHIGEPGPDPAQFGDGSYSGYYAVSPNTNAVLVHATLTATNQPVLHNDFQNQLEIMTTSGQVNYLDCAAITNSDGTYWTLVHGYGDTVEASHFDTLWVDTSANQPLTRECTVITNGENYLKLYMDGVMVYSSNTLSLAMPAPFNYYLQTMNSYYNQMRYGVFKDYYATTDENIQVTGNPSNAVTVSLVDSSGTTLTSSSVTAGSATLDVGKYHFPLAATIQVSDSSGNVITSSPETIYGGDAFAVSVGGTATAPQPPTNLSASAISSSQINLSWSAPSDNGGSTITGYQIERSPDGSTWNTIVSNTGSTATTYSDTGLTASTAYTYRVSTINGVGTSSPSNTASATTSDSSATVSQPPTGLAVSSTKVSTINLSWNAPSSDGGSPIIGYEIQRSTNGGSWSTIVSNTGSTATTYSDTGLLPLLTYTYKVSAINAIGTSSPSNTASSTTLLLGPLPMPGGLASLGTVLMQKLP